MDVGYSLILFVFLFLFLLPFHFSWFSIQFKFLILWCWLIVYAANFDHSFYEIIERRKISKERGLFAAFIEIQGLEEISNLAWKATIASVRFQFHVSFIIVIPEMDNAQDVDRIEGGGRLFSVSPAKRHITKLSGNNIIIIWSIDYSSK